MTAAAGRTARPAGWWVWLAGAPLAVAVTLLATRNVFAVFAVYQVGICLVLPALYNLVGRQMTLAAHLDFLGFAGGPAVRGIRLGLGLAALFAAGTLGAFHWWGEVFLADHDVPGILAGWGVNRGNLPVLLWFMTLVNGPAEEMYWRGFVHTLVAVPGQGWGPILLIAACYASYHGLTVHLLVANPWVSLLFTAAIFGAGVFWGLLRARTGSVWPALLSHGAAALAYMLVARSLIEF